MLNKGIGKVCGVRCVLIINKAYAFPPSKTYKNKKEEIDKKLNTLTLPIFDVIQSIFK